MLTDPKHITFVGCNRTGFYSVLYDSVEDELHIQAHVSFPCAYDLIEDSKEISGTLPVLIFDADSLDYVWTNARIEESNLSIVKSIVVIEVYRSRQ